MVKVKSVQLANAKPARVGRPTPALPCGSHEKWVVPNASFRINNKLYPFSMLLFGALPSILVLRVLRLFAADNRNLLSMNILHNNYAYFNRGQLCPIKPNQVIFDHHTKSYFCRASTNI